MGEVSDLRFQVWEMEENGTAVMVETSAEMTGVVEGLISYHHGYSRRSDALADLQAG